MGLSLSAAPQRGETSWAGQPAESGKLETFVLIDKEGFLQPLS